MDQRRSLHPLGEGYNILGADDVGAQTTLERRIKSHVAGGIYDDVEVTRDALRFPFGKAEILFGDIAVHHYHLIANESVEGVTVALSQRIERRRGDDVIPKASFGLFRRSGPHGDVNAPDVRKAMQQHAQRHLAEKPGAADQKDLSVLIDFSRRELCHSFLSTQLHLRNSQARLPP